MSFKSTAALCVLTSITAFAIGDKPSSRPFVIGHLDTPLLCESSGIVESRKHPGVFWTHNDSGNAPILYAIRRDGSLINQFPIHTLAIDWEDIAIDDDGHLYLGDIGNNAVEGFAVRHLRAAIGVTMIDEPDPNVVPDPKKWIEPMKQWLLTYKEGQRMDCESLFIWKGMGYILKKSIDRSPTTMWKFALEKETPQELEFVATVPIEGKGEKVGSICTAADLSSDGDRLAVMTVDGPVLISGLKGDLSTIEKCPTQTIRIEPRTNEAICFTVEGLIGTDEQRDVYFFAFEAFAVKSSTQPSR